ncbi:MAG TPA: hypothetical protein VLL75_06140 [Vicinamibacteria bacterium]|nr:hypothetical protein [Vicinamibacteria bacterium]
MIPLVECAGAPRDLGWDQGAACGPEVRARLAAGPVHLTEPRVARDLWRHFPQLAERSAGLARGARVVCSALVVPLEQELGRPGGGSAGGLALGIDPARSGGPPLLVRGLEAGAARDLCLRRSRPDHGFASLEVTLPWLVASLAGVNEAGLAATAASLPGSGPGPCAAPALLLLQDCLARFDSTQTAVEWCLRRPAGGRASLLFADARGAQLGVLVDGSRRRVVAPEDGLLAAADPSPRALALAKACREARILDGVALERIRADAAEGLVWLDPTGCRLGRLVGPADTAEPDGVRFVPVLGSHSSPAGSSRPEGLCRARRTR